MFVAAIPVCGGGDPDLAEKIIDVKVWAFHGRKDKTVPVRFSRGMIKAIKKAGGDPLYTEFPDGPHNIWSDVNHTPGYWTGFLIRNIINQLCLTCNEAIYFVGICNALNPTPKLLQYKYWRLTKSSPIIKLPQKTFYSRKL